MTPEEKSLLERTHALAEENNAILRKLRRNSRWSAIFKICYWLIIIGLGLGAYYALQPYLLAATGIIDKGQNAIQNIGNLGK